jgi:hypothetical protein
MRVEESIMIKADINTVWNIFCNLTCWQDWNTILKNDSCTEGACITEGQKFACRIRPFFWAIDFEPEVQEVVPCVKVVWTAYKYGISARHEFRFRAENDHVRVTSHEIFSGAPVAFAAPLFPRSRIQDMTRTLLEDLKKAAESERK